jgi:hypothetical protein
MSDEARCERVRQLAPDLAAEIADGQDRDAAFRHVASCAECRGLVGDLSSVVDEVLLLAPEHEPPAGFAARTAERLAGLSGAAPVRERAWRRRPRWTAGLAAAAAFALAVALGSAGALLATSADRRLAESYRAVLAQGRGSFFVAAPLRGSLGTYGTVFGYQGDPSWLFATVRLPVAGPERFRVELDTKDGRTVPLGITVLGGDRLTWGAAIPVDLTGVARLRFEKPGGRSAFAAYIVANDPWGGG